MEWDAIQTVITHAQTKFHETRNQTDSNLRHCAPNLRLWLHINWELKMATRVQSFEHKHQRIKTFRFRFIEPMALPGITITREKFWKSFISRLIVTTYWDCSTPDAASVPQVLVTTRSWYTSVCQLLNTLFSRHFSPQLPQLSFQKAS